MTFTTPVTRTSLNGVSQQGFPQTVPHYSLNIINSQTFPPPFANLPQSGQDATSPIDIAIKVDGR